MPDSQSPDPTTYLATADHVTFRSDEFGPVGYAVSPEQTALQREYLILLPDGSFAAPSQLTEVSPGVLTGAYASELVGVILDLGNAVEAVAKLMRKAAHLGVAEYRPTVYRRLRLTVRSLPEMDVEAEELLDTPVVLE